MMLRAPFKKTLVNNLFGIAIFYSFLVFLLILVPLVLRLFPQLEQNIMMNGGFEMFSLIFIFVLALTTVKDNLYASMVFGRSRKTAVLSGVLSLVVCAAVLALLDSVFNPLASMISRGVTYWGLMFQIFQFPVTGSPFSYFGTYLIWRFFLYYAMAMFGYLLSSINYRLNKLGRWIFWVAFGLIAIILLPVSFESSSPFAFAIAGFIHFCLASSVWGFCLSMLLFSVVASFGSWLLQRRA